MPTVNPCPYNAQRPFRGIEVGDRQTSARIEEEPLQSYDAGIALHSGKQRGAEADVFPAPVGNPIVIAERGIRTSQSARCEINFGRCIANRTGFPPERAYPSRELALLPIGHGATAFVRRDAVLVTAKRANDFDGGAPRKAFEQDTAFTDPDRKARAMIVMGGATAHCTRWLPFAAQGFDDAGGGGVQAGIGAGPRKGHEKNSS